MLKKKNIVKKLQTICKQKREHFQKEGNEQKVKVFSAIEKLLFFDNPFDKLDISTSLNILYDLLDDMNEAKDIYKILILKKEKT